MKPQRPASASAVRNKQLEAYAYTSPMRRGWRPASARRVSAGGGVFRGTAAHGFLRTEHERAPPPFVEQLASRDSPRKPPTSRRAAPLLVTNSGVASEQQDIAWLRIATLARRRIEDILFASANIPDHEPQAARDAKALCSVAADPYERELRHTLAAAASAARQQPAADAALKVLRLHLDAWRRRVEESGVILRAGLAVQALATAAATTSSAAASESEAAGGSPASLCPAPASSALAKASEHALLANEVSWVLERSRPVLTAMRLRGELFERLRSRLPGESAPSASLHAAIDNLGLEDVLAAFADETRASAAPSDSLPALSLGAGIAADDGGAGTEGALIAPAPSPMPAAHGAAAGLLLDVSHALNE